MTRKFDLIAIGTGSAAGKVPTNLKIPGAEPRLATRVSCSGLMWSVPFSDKGEFAYSCSTTLKREVLI